MNIRFSSFIIPSMIVAFFISMTLYEQHKIKSQLSVEELKKTEGLIDKIDSYNAFSLFYVNGIVFRSESWTSPCLDVRKEIQVRRKVSIEYKNVPKWPGTLSEYSCVLSIKYLSRKTDQRIGHARKNT